MRGGCCLDIRRQLNTHLDDRGVPYWYCVRDELERGRGIHSTERQRRTVVYHLVEFSPMINSIISLISRFTGDI